MTTEQLQNQIEAAGGASIVDRRVSRLVDRFLAWPLPESVCSDECASMPGYPHRCGTNLLTATEARQMLEHVLAEALNFDCAATEEEGDAFMHGFFAGVEHAEAEKAANAGVTGLAPGKDDK